MSAAQGPERVASALALAQAGLRVFPVHSIHAAGGCTCRHDDCDHPGKHPRTTHGFHDAVSDPNKIRAWWRRWPDANVAIATGDGLFVLDIDPRHGGDVALARLVEQFGPLPATPTVDTGGGGQHYYFAINRRIRRSSLCEGIDVRADGGYVIVPPSRHLSGLLYAWRQGRTLDDLPRAPLPDWIVGKLDEPRRNKKSGAARESRGQGVCQGRNNHLTSVAGKLRREGEELPQILSAIQAENLAVCHPPLELKEVEKIAGSVSQYPTPEQNAEQALGVLESLAADADAAQFEAALEAFGACANQMSGVRLEMMREKAVELLRERGHRTPARLVNVAMEGQRQAVPVTTTSREQPSGGSCLQLEVPPPWDCPVSTGEILAELEAVVCRHLVLPRHCAPAIALWILHTHAFDAAQISARLAIVSPTKRCGKSTLLKLLEALTPRSLLCTNVTAPVVFRIIEAFRPTLLVDEADTFLREREELRGILNAGHDRATARVPRCQGEDFEPRLFSVWAPAAIAAIGRLPDTLMDRAIVVEMRRRAPNETVMPFRRRERDALYDVSRRCRRWAVDHEKLLHSACPSAPAGLGDRAADNWEALFAIADLVGAAFAALARTVAVELGKRGSADEDDDAPPRELLLADVRAVFEERKCDRFRTKDLLDALHRLEERPWKEFRHGRELNTNHLCRMLRTFGVASKCIRLGSDPHDVCRGFLRADFEEAFARYLPPAVGVTGVTCSVLQENLVDSKTLQNPHVTPSESPESSCDFANVTPVTFSPHADGADPSADEERSAIQEEGCSARLTEERPAVVDVGQFALFENVTDVTSAIPHDKVTTSKVLQTQNVTFPKSPETTCSLADVTPVTPADPSVGTKQVPDDASLVPDEAKGDKP